MLGSPAYMKLNGSLQSRLEPVAEALKLSRLCDLPLSVALSKLCQKNAQTRCSGAPAERPRSPLYQLCHAVVILALSDMLSPTWLGVAMHLQPSIDFIDFMLCLEFHSSELS